MAEQERQLRERFKDDGLQRLVKANPDYYNSHGHYVPELAALLLIERAKLSRLVEALEHVEAHTQRHIRDEADAGRDASDLIRLRELARSALTAEDSEEGA